MGPYKTTAQIYAQAIAPCIYCLEGKCAERKKAKLCHCSNHAETPAKTEESSAARTSKESELVTTN